MMKNILLLIAIILLPFKVCFSQTLDKSIKDLLLRYYADAYCVYYGNPNVKGYDSLLYKNCRSFDTAQSPLKEWKEKINVKSIDGILDEATLSYKDLNHVPSKYIYERLDSIVKSKIDSTSQNYSLYPSNYIDSLKQKNSSVEAQQKIISSEEQKQQSVKKNDPDAEESDWFDCLLNYIPENWLLLLIILLETIFLAFVIKKFNSDGDKEEYLEAENNNLKSENKRLTRDFDSLKNEFDGYKKKQSSKTTSDHQEPVCKQEQKKVVAEPKPQPQPASVAKEKKYEYLCQLNSKGDVCFYRVQDKYDSSSFYRMYDKKDGKAKFEFYGDEVRALANWSSFLVSVSTYDGDPDNSKHIKTLEPGIVQYDEANERWKVINKAKLKLS